MAIEFDIYKRFTFLTEDML